MSSINELYNSIRLISHDVNNGVYELMYHISGYALDFKEFEGVEKKSNKLAEYASKLTKLRINIEENKKIDDNYLNNTKSMQKSIVGSCLDILESIKEEYFSSKLDVIKPESKDEFVKIYTLLKEILQYKNEFNPKLVSFKSIKDKFTELFISEGIDVIFKDKSKTPIYADADNLVFALLNLSKNSVTAIKEGHLDRKGRISIIADEYSINHILIVNDNGPGFKNPDTAEKLFTTKFTSKDDSINHGLGTKIVKKIVDDLKGNIYVKSLQGIGTSIEIVIPKHNEYPDLNLLNTITLEQF